LRVIMTPWGRMFIRATLKREILSCFVYRWAPALNVMAPSSSSPTTRRRWVEDVATMAHQFWTLPRFAMYKVSEQKMLGMGRMEQRNPRSQLHRASPPSSVHGAFGFRQPDDSGPSAPGSFVKPPQHDSVGVARGSTDQEAHIPLFGGLPSAE
jgi:hypothetical protein